MEILKRNKEKGGFMENNDFLEFNKRFQGLLKVAERPLGQEKITENYCGFPIEHDYPALTPRLWNSVYKKFNCPTRAVMLVGDTTQVKEILSFLKKDEKFQGGGLGVGFKDEAIKQKALDRLEPLAEVIGAANVVVKKDGELIGYNTDGFGYVLSLEEKMAELKKDLAKANILILGAGGTASAIAFTLAGKVKKIIILNRTLDKAEGLYQRLSSYVEKLPKSCGTIIEFGGENEISKVAKQSDIILNTTLKGATGKFEKFVALSETSSESENLKMNEEILRSVKQDTLISDVNLTDGDPVTIALAKKFGLPTLDGRPMVLYQAIEAFSLVNSLWLKEKGLTKNDVKRTMLQII